MIFCLLIFTLAVLQKNTLRPYILGLFFFLNFMLPAWSVGDSIRYEIDVRPLLVKKCISCHNTNAPKAGVNIDNYKEQDRVIKDGAFWLKVLDQIKSRHMPPKSEPTLSESDYDQLVTGIDRILQTSLKNKTPGHIVIRRLSHPEYQYTIKDLFDIDFEAKKYFPSDGSGGGGFDNQGRALFFTPLKFERYYDAADLIVEKLRQDSIKWASLVPFRYKETRWKYIVHWFKSFFNAEDSRYDLAEQSAMEVLIPIATKAYRRFLKDEEKTKLLTLFQTVYSQKDTFNLKPQYRFDEGIAQCLKAILVSPNFLYKVEEEPEKEGSYAINDFELATRLSAFLWSSMPDQELFDLAYQGKLQDTAILAAQARRMLRDPKAKRFAENFAVQWLGIGKLLEKEPIVDTDKFPGFEINIRQSLYQETVEYFYYVLTGSKNLLDLINSDYAFLNKDLATYYGIDGVDHQDFQKVTLKDQTRGGVLGMGSVLATTSFPMRTSPVNRGKWVMEQILGISPPPPPAVVAELTEDKATHDALGLRKILEAHRAKPECRSCHEKMDPLGLGLENFDPTGRWRDSYGKVAIDPSGITADGQKFKGPVELKVILMEEKTKFARNMATKMLSYALGRSMLFTDEPALVILENTLLANNFDPEPFILELVKSYPFTMKLNDFEKKSI